MFFFLTTLLLTAFLMRMQNISAPLFYDEAVYVNLAQHPFHSDFYDEKIFSHHPPLYYLCLAVVGNIINFSEASMRIFSILMGCASIFLTYLLGKIYRNQTIGIIAALLLTLNIMHQQYSQAATMYALFCFLLTLTIYGMKKDDERLVFAGFLLSIYTHYFGFYLAPPLALYYFQKFNGNWKKILGRISLLILLYLPWLITMINGMNFHSTRLRGMRWWDFQLSNIVLHLSITLIVGLIYFLYKSYKKREEWPIFIFIGSFLLSALILISFRRYLLPFLPTFIVLGVAGSFDLIHNLTKKSKFILSGKLRKDFLLKVIFTAGLFFPNAQAYGLYPQMGSYLDLRDSIHTQEWRKVVAAIPSGKVAINNPKSLLFYGNLKGSRNYLTAEFNERSERFHELIASQKYEWVIISKYERFHPLIEYIQLNSSYITFLELPYTIVFRKE